MTIMNKVKGIVKRSLPSWPDSDDRWYQIPYTVGGVSSFAGIDVNTETALRLSAVHACIQVLQNNVASLPCYLYQRKDDGGKRRIGKTDSPSLLRRQHLFSRKVNPEMPAFRYFGAGQSHLAAWGNHYSYVERDNLGFPLALWPLNPACVQVQRDKNGELEYVFNAPNGGQRIFSYKQIFHVPGFGYNGVVGKSPLALAREGIGLAMAAQELGSRFFSQGMHHGGIIEYPGKLSPEAKDRFKKDSREKYQGLGRAHDLMLLEGGVKYTQVTIPPNDAQFLETRKFQVEEICRIYLVPPHMIGHTDKQTSWGTGIEQQTIGFVKFTLLYWLKLWETSLNYYFLNEDEQDDYFYEFMLDHLLRGDQKSRYESYQIARNAGLMNADEIRAKENMEPEPNGQGKIYVVQAGVQNLKDLKGGTPPPPQLPGTQKPPEEEPKKEIPDEEKQRIRDDARWRQERKERDEKDDQWKKQQEEEAEKTRAEVRLVTAAMKGLGKAVDSLPSLVDSNTKKLRKEIKESINKISDRVTSLEDIDIVETVRQSLEVVRSEITELTGKIKETEGNALTPEQLEQSLADLRNTLSNFAQRIEQNETAANAIKELQKPLKSLKDGMGSMSKRLDNMEASQGIKDGRQAKAIQDLQKSMDSLESNLSNFSKRLETAEKDEAGMEAMKALGASLDSLKKDFTGFSQRFETVEKDKSGIAAINDLKKPLDTLQANFANISKRLDIIEKDNAGIAAIEQLGESFKSFKDDLNGFSIRIKGIENDESAKEAVGGLNTSLDSLKDDFSTFLKRFEVLESDKSGVMAAKDLEKPLNSLKDGLASISKRFETAEKGKDKDIEALGKTIDPLRESINELSERMKTIEANAFTKEILSGELEKPISELNEGLANLSERTKGIETNALTREIISEEFNKPLLEIQNKLVDLVNRMEAVENDDKISDQERDHRITNLFGEMGKLSVAIQSLDERLIDKPDNTTTLIEQLSKMLEGKFQNLETGQAERAKEDRDFIIAKLEVQKSEWQAAFDKLVAEINGLDTKFEELQGRQDISEAERRDEGKLLAGKYEAMENRLEGLLKKRASVGTDAIVKQFQPLIQDAIQNVVNREAIATRKALKRLAGAKIVQNMTDWIEEFYRDQREYVTMKVGPSLKSFTEAIVTEMTLNLDTEGEISDSLNVIVENIAKDYMERHIQSSKEQLKSLLTLKVGMPEAINHQMDEWHEQRAGKDADLEVKRINDAINELIFVKKN